MDPTLDINSDLDPNAVPTDEETASTYGNVAQEVDLPPSEADQVSNTGMSFEAQPVSPSLFDPEPGEEVEPSLYDSPDFSKGSTVPVPAKSRPVAASMLAIATSESYRHPALVMAESNLSAARDLLDSQGEYSARIKVALERQKNQLFQLEKYKKTMQQQANTEMFSPEAQKAIDTAYADAVNQRVEDNAKTAMEYEVVERVQDTIANGDPVQAKVIWDLYGADQRGNTQKVFHDEAVKNLIMAQRIEELRAEKDDEGWARYLTNFVLSALVPFSTNFDRSGVLDDAEIANQATNVGNFFFSGSGLQQQANSLWNLPPAQFATAMAKDGAVIKAIKANAGLLFDSPSDALDILNSLNYQSESDVAWANAWGVIDPLTALPWMTAGKVGGALTRMGGRRAAAEYVAGLYDDIIARGADDVAERTGVRESDVIEEIEIRPATDTGAEVSRAMDIDAHMAAGRRVIDELPKTMAGSRFTSEEELAAAFDKAADKAMEDFGQSLKDTRKLTENVSTGETKLFEGVLDENGDIIGIIEGTFGRKGGGGFARESTAKGQATKMGFDADEVEIVRDVSGQYFFKAKMNVRDEGFIVTELETPAGSMMNNVGVRSSARTSDASLQAKALGAGNSHVRIQTALTGILKDSLKGISSKQMKSLREVVKKGQTQTKWLTPEEFAIDYERVSGKLPSQRVTNAYKTYVVMNDADWVWRNDALRLERARRGAESVKFSMGKTGMDVDTDAVIKTGRISKPLDEAFDASTGQWLNKISPDDLAKMMDEGYVRLELQDVFKFPDGMATNSVLIKKSDLARRPLRRKVLAYSEGGHRAYAGTNYAKQAAKDAGGRYLNPHTFITGNNKNVMQKWADRMNDAIEDFKRGYTNPDHYDDNIFNGERGLPTGRQFIEDMEAGRISKDSKIEIVADRDLPSEYSSLDESVLSFVDPTESPVMSHARTNGRMYYSKKGEQLRDAYGEFAETLDPWETLNTALSNSARLSSFSAYKTNALERFKKTYGAGLKLKDVENSNNLYALINAEVKDGIPLELSRKIKQEQLSMRLILNHETGFEKAARAQSRALAEWALGSSINDKGMRQAIHDGIYKLEKNNPVSGLRGWAFDAKLGLFNFGQFFIQTSTMLSATALSPKLGLQGMSMAFPMMHLARSSVKGRASLTDLLAKRGVWKMGGFADEAEFREFARYMDQTGIMQVGNTHAQINMVGPNRVFGATSKLDSAREAGRGFFYAAEQMNRATASRIAWGELKEAGVEVGTSQFRDRFVQLVDDYSMNMMQQSQARFQSGLISIPTQFWAYGVRMMDAMLGKRFTAAQKARLWIASAAMAGTAGVPLGEQIAGMFREGETPGFDGDAVEQTVATFERGLLDRGIYEIFGADVRAGEKIGTSGMLVNVALDLFSAGDFGDKSTADMLAGATGSISASAGETLFKILKYAGAEMGGDGPGLEMTGDAMLELAKEISIVNNGLQAVMVNQYGIYKSKRGTVQADDLPSESAFFIAMGLQPQKVEELSNYFNYFKNKDESIKDAAKIVKNYRQEAFTNPDKYDINMKKVNAFMKMLPEDLQRDVRKASSPTSIKDKSLWDSMDKKWHEEMLNKRVQEAVDNANSEESN